jgi:hypothetical protein
MIQKPNLDPIVDEIHTIRQEISVRFGGDVHAIAADANARLLASGCQIWRHENNPSINQSVDSDRSAGMVSQLSTAVKLLVNRGAEALLPSGDVRSLLSLPKGCPMPKGQRKVPKGPP